jgi:3-isopropylmalate/(R)-2-methylmalate dehydratase large subunit
LFTIVKPKTLFDKIWDAHIVKRIEGGPGVLYIDRHFIHEVTSPQAFSGLEKRGIRVFRPEQTLATADHNVPTRDQHLPISEAQSREQVKKLQENCERHGITMYGLNHPYHGIVHVIGPELGITQPGMTIVCGDSHTSTHGAFGCVAFGIGTSEVEMVLASQAILQSKPRNMRITVNGKLGKGVTSKDVILYIISRLSTDGGMGHFIEYGGSTIRDLSMEARMTICNMSIEMGARGGLIAPDEKTLDYLKNKPFAPKGKRFEQAVKPWSELKSDERAHFDKEYSFEAEEVEPMITYGTNPGMGMKISGKVPSIESVPPENRSSFSRSLEYMGIEPGSSLLEKSVDYVFVGSCTNGRIEDFRLFAYLVKGKKRESGVTVWLVPGSKQVEQQIRNEGVDKILEDAGFELRQPGCSACLAMNEDKVPAGKYTIATSNRNFEGRQGPGARTFLAGPLVAAAAALTGKITNPTDLL